MARVAWAFAHPARRAERLRATAGPHADRASALADGVALVHAHRAPLADSHTNCYPTPYADARDADAHSRSRRTTGGDGVSALQHRLAMGQAQRRLA